MANESKARPSLRRYLLTWFVGCAIIMVFAYTQLLEYYVELGIEIRTQSILERTAIQYAQDQDAKPKLPSDQNLRGYLDLSAIPVEILSKFALNNLSHGNVQRFVNLDFEDDDEYPDGKRFRITTFDLCGEQTCELLFLYPYKLNDGRWLYLLHGVVGSEEDYEELELTEQVAFAIGSLFAGLLIFVSFFVVRSLVAPLRKLASWSEQQSVEVSAAPPDLRFSEYETLANRLQEALQSVRDGALREKLFLRHASHELRTPIAILSSNLELLDRLTERADRSAEESAALLRQYRAVEDVQLLIETLLWINRQTEQVPSADVVDLRHEVAVIVDSFRYLLDEEGVDLVVEGQATLQAVPLAAVRIVVSNLVKNAFQYTKGGQVRITMASNQMTVENSSAVELDQVESDDYGFGLGLELVELICQRLQWQYSHVEIAGGRRTTVEFSC